MMRLFPEHNIVYVDADAEFLAYPQLFETFKGDIGVYEFDRTCYHTNNGPETEILSGTVFLRNCERVINVVKEWERECKDNPKAWDQLSLEKVLDGRFTHLPGEYCKIFDRMQEVKKPVIVHHQLSRKIRRRNGKLT
jgi:hypothetical protein